jgi:hypothetical protein
MIYIINQRDKIADADVLNETAPISVIVTSDSLTFHP